MKSRIVVALLLTVLLTSFAACGRFGPPFPPEAIAPKAVGDLTANANASGVVFTWSAPDRDRRGKELQFIDGYRLQRKELVERGDETDPSVTFDDVGFVEDHHIEVREKMREEARAEGKVGRKIKGPPEMRQFTFTDPTAETGKTYLYRIVPENQGGTKGQISQIVKVVFRGDTSDVSILDSLELEEEGTDDEEISTDGL